MPTPSPVGRGLSHFEHHIDQSDHPLVDVPGSFVRPMDYSLFDQPAIHV